MTILRKLHARFSASATSRWFKCPGSVKLAEAVPYSRSSPSAEDGTEAHELLEFCLMGGIRSAREGHAGGKFQFEYRTDSYAERMDGVQVALDYTYSLLDQYPGAELHLEVSFQFPSTAAPGEAYGTSDIVILVPLLGYMFVLDYKHGFNIVEVENNSQCLTYANGAIAEFDPGYDTYHTVCMVIMQPRAFHADGPVREWYADVGTVLDFIPVFDMNVRAALALDAPLVPGEAQCRFCPANVTCPAYEAQALARVGAHFKTVKDISRHRLPTPEALGVERIAYALSAKSLVMAFFDAIEEHANTLAMQGVYIPDFKLVEAQAKRSWDEDHDNIAHMMMLYLGTDNEEDVRPRKLLTITDAERKLKAHFRATLGLKGKGGANKSSEMASQVMAEFTTKSTTGKLTLVHSSDKRPAVDRVARDFQAVQMQNMKTLDGTATRIEK